MKHTRLRFLFAGLAVALAGLALAGLAGAAPADVVVGTGTPGSCTESNLNAALPLGTRFVFDCGGPATITFTSAIALNGLAVIDGGGVITLTGNNATRLFVVGDSGMLTLYNIVVEKGYSGGANGGAIYNNSYLSLYNSRITNSNTDGNHYGGAIGTIGTVTLHNSELDHNNAGYGGAVDVEGDVGGLYLYDSALVFNTAQNAGGGGGAVFLGAGNSLLMSGGEMNHNQAAVAGGALYISAGAGATIVGGSAGVAYLNVNSTQNSGGAIYNSAGQLSLDQVDLEYNTIPTATLDYGGGIANLGAMSLSNSRIANNQGRYGGGIFVGGNLISTTAGITHTLFFANLAGVYGGGLYTNFGGTSLTIEDSAFQYNQAAAGGGLARTNATLNISKSSFTNNQAQYGGGLFLQGLPNPADGPYVEIRDTTISGNLATGQHSGGIDNAALLDLRNVTIKDNHYGLWGENSATARLQNSVLDNSLQDCDGDLPTSSGHNLATDSSCNLTGFGDQSAVPAGLGPLVYDPAVFTQFHMPQFGSLLINNAGGGCAATDQRYATRPDACDIGAIEFGGLLARLWLPLVRK